MTPTREGLFNAYPVDVGIDETGQNKLATCIIVFRLYEELQQSGEWADCSGENLQVTGYFYLEKKDGSLNTVSIDALKAALGWDGRDPFWLQDTDLSQHAVQVRLAFEEYGGKTRLKVQYLNPHGSTNTGGATKADGPTRKNIVNRLGSKLRAVAGPAQPATKPSAPAKPAAPPKPARPAPQPPPVAPPVPAAPAPAPGKQETPVNPQTASADEAWAEFSKSCPTPPAGKWDRASIEKEWFRIIADLFPGRQPDQLTPQDWAVMRDQGPGKVIPF